MRNRPLVLAAVFLSLAGAGYAMGNADEAVRAAADLVCAPCREQGVLRVLEQLWPG